MMHTNILPKNKLAFLLFFYVYIFCSILFTITEPRSYRNYKESLLNLDVQNIPMQVMGGTALIVAIIILILYKLQNKNHLFVVSNNKDSFSILISVLLFIGASILSSFLGYKPTITPYIFAEFLIYLSVYFVLDLELNEFIHTVKRLLLIIIYGTILLIFVNPLWSIQFEYDQGIINFFSARLYGLTTNSNYTAPLLLLYFIFELEYPSKNKMRVPNLILSLLLILFTQSKTVWIMLFIYGLIKAIQNRKINKPVLLTVSLLIIILPFLFLFLGNVSYLSTFTGRTIIWNFTLDAWQQNKLFGYGMGLWNEEMFLQYKHLIKEGWVFSHAHSQYYQTLGETGIIGLILLFIYYTVLVYCGVKYIEETKGLSYYFALFMIIRGWTEPVFRHFFIDFNFLIHLLIFTYLILITKKTEKTNVM